MSMYKIVRKRDDNQIYLYHMIDRNIVGGPYKTVKLARLARNRKEKDQIMESCGLVKVKSASGRTYWE